MSTRAHLATAARVVVCLCAPIVLYAWIMNNPASCSMYKIDLPLKLAAIGLVALSLTPLLTRIGRPPFLDRRMIFDVTLVVSMLGLVLFMRSGAGRLVVYDGCGVYTPPTEPTQATDR